MTGEVPDDWPEDEEPDADTLLFLEVYPYATHRPRATVGRNDRCPCGSGKKYKACHLGRESFSLEDRAPWLSDKVLRFARSSPHVMDAVGALADNIAGPDDQAELRPRDLALRHRSRLHEGGLFEVFLAAGTPSSPTTKHSPRRAGPSPIDRCLRSRAPAIRRSTSSTWRPATGSRSRTRWHPIARRRECCSSVGPWRLPTLPRISGFMPLDRRYLDEMLAAIADREQQGSPRCSGGGSAPDV